MLIAGIWVEEHLFYPDRANFTNWYRQKIRMSMKIADLFCFIFYDMASAMIKLCLNVK